MKVRQTFALDPDVREFVNMQKNASKFVNLVLKRYMINSFGDLSESKIKDFERVWEDVYPDIEELIAFERKTLSERQYKVSESIINLFYDICIRVNLNVSKKDCKSFITTKVIRCKYE